MRQIRLIAAAAVIAAAGWVTVDWLVEAYGSGPPFYSRTTNLDKWVSPWPALLLIDGAALATAFLIAPRRRTKSR